MTIVETNRIRNLEFVTSLQDSKFRIPNSKFHDPHPRAARAGAETRAVTAAAVAASGTNARTASDRPDPAAHPRRSPAPAITALARSAVRTRPRRRGSADSVPSRIADQRRSQLHQADVAHADPIG